MVETTKTNIGAAPSIETSTLDRFFLLNQDGRFVALEGLRAWAILSVFSVHFNADWSARKLDHPGLSRLISSITFGHLGVDLFFVLSGFLIYRLVTIKKPGFVPFILNRYERLLPAHVAITLLGMTTSSLLANLANITFLNYFFPALPALNFITWSLSYEILFYVICAFSLISSKCHLPGKLWLCLVAACFLLSYFTLPVELFGDQSKYRMPDVRFMGFFAGVAAAMFYETELYRKSQTTISVLGIAGLLLCVFLSRYVWGYHYADVIKPPFISLFYLASDIGFAFICLAAVTPSTNLIKRCFSLKPLRIMGIVSYSFYLSHAIISIPIANRITDQFDQLRIYGLSFLLSLAVAFLISTYLFHYLEKPYFKNRSVPRSDDMR